MGGAVQTAVQNEEPLFRGTKACLAFAMNYSAGISGPSWAKMGKPNPEGRGLVGLDGAAQAGMIQAELSRLVPARRWILVARMAVPRLPCACRRPCCVGYVERREWGEAVDALAEYVLTRGLTGTVSHFHLRRIIVMRYFGDLRGLTTIAKQAGVNRDTASLYNKRVVEHLAKEERMAWLEIGNYLEAAGLVE